MEQDEVSALLLPSPTGCSLALKMSFSPMQETAGALPSPPGEQQVEKALREPQKGPSGPSNPSLQTRGDLWEMAGRWPSATAEPLRCGRGFICMPKW